MPQDNTLEALAVECEEYAAKMLATASDKSGFRDDSVDAWSIDVALEYLDRASRLRAHAAKDRNP